MKKIVLVAILAVFFAGCNKPQEQDPAPIKNITAEVNTEHEEKMLNVENWERFTFVDRGVSFAFPENSGPNIIPTNPNGYFIDSNEENIFIGINPVPATTQEPITLLNVFNEYHDMSRSWPEMQEYTELKTPFPALYFPNITEEIPYERDYVGLENYTVLVGDYVVTIQGEVGKNSLVMKHIFESLKKE